MNITKYTDMAIHITIKYSIYQILIFKNSYLSLKGRNCNLITYKYYVGTMYLVHIKQLPFLLTEKMIHDRKII